MLIAIALLLAAILVVLVFKKPIVDLHVTQPVLPAPAPPTVIPPLPKEMIRDFIRQFLSELRSYESEHVRRQRERLAKARRHGSQKPLRAHGEYAPDQVREHILIRLRQRFRVGLPADLSAILREEVPDEE